MVSKVECVFRAAEKAITINGIFNLVNGTIEGYEDLMQLNVASMYNFYDDNYKEGYMRIEKLYEALFKYEDALVAINWNNTGVLLVYPNMVRLYIVATGELKPHISINKQIFFKEYKLLAIAKSKVHSYEELQPMMYLPYVEIDGDVEVLTYEGKKKFKGDLELIDEPKILNGEKYLLMCNSKESKGLVAMKDGTNRILSTYGTWISQNKDL